jgi:hypothetical protein
MKTIATATALAAAATLAAAGAAAAPDAKADKGKETAKPAGLNPGLAPLAPMLGEWDCVETYHAGGFSPKESSAKGTDVLRIGPGGNAVIADYSSSGDFGPYVAHDMITWDEADRQFHFLFIDSFGAAVQLHRGKAAGGSFVFEGPFTFNGKRGTMRRTYKDITQTSTTLTADFIDDKGAVTKLVTIQKRRKT